MKILQNISPRSKMVIKILLLLTILISTVAVLYQTRKDIRIGSKNFPESRLLGEIIATLIETKTELSVGRKFDLKGTLICFEALRTGEIDIYPEYTGTAWTAIMHKKEKVSDPQELYRKVNKNFNDKYQIQWFTPFGFNNTYALAVKNKKWNINKISELVKYKDTMRIGVTHEFLKRPDGYPGLSKHYGFTMTNVKGLEHGLAYQAIKEDKIDLIDAYSTDGKLEKYKLKLLQDDLEFFPPYYAAPIVNQNTLKKYPQLKPLLEKLGNQLDDDSMRQLNYRVEVNKESFAKVAQDFLIDKELIDPQQAPTQGGRVPIWRHVGEHMYLVLIATGLAILVGVPLGLLVSRYEVLAPTVLGTTGVIQTIPSLAILGFMIPIFGIGVVPAIAALFLYCLLPIVRNTYTGIKGVDPNLKQAAQGMGMTPMQIMFMLELPLATKVIMAGIRTATVICVGTATLAAFIGAGGLGEPIVTGLSLNDNNLILWGAIPAAILALVVDFILAVLENILEPTGLQIQQQISK